MAVTRQEKLLNSVANGVPSDITPRRRKLNENKAT